MKKLLLFLYALTFFAVLVADRLTKLYAVNSLTDTSCRVNKFLSFELVFNRGVTWGLFSSSNQLFFFLLSSISLGVTFFLARYMYMRWCQEKPVLGELFVVAGAIGNSIDRFWYHGVVDFIHVSIGTFSWPLFNVADIAIVIGVLFMFVTHIVYQ